MPALLARLSRIAPLLILLLVIAGVVYIVMSFRYSSDRAKATLIKIFTWLTAILSIGFAIVTIYALFEQNTMVLEMFASFMATTLIGLIITRICNAVFKRNHPHYGEEVAQATIVNESIASRFAEAFRKAFGEALRDTFKKR